MQTAGHYRIFAFFLYDRDEKYDTHPKIQMIWQQGAHWFYTAVGSFSSLHFFLVAALE